MPAADELHRLCDLVIQGWDEAGVPEDQRMQMVQQLQGEIAKGGANPQGGSGPRMSAIPPSGGSPQGGGVPPGALPAQSAVTGGFPPAPPTGR